MKRLKNQKGQAILETVLLIAIIFGVWTGLTKSLNHAGVFQKVFGDPWARLANTIEFGVPSSNAGVGAAHPASVNRHSARRPTGQ